MREIKRLESKPLPRPLDEPGINSIIHAKNFSFICREAKTIMEQCLHCDLRFTSTCENISCGSDRRKDKKDVIFVKLD